MIKVSGVVIKGKEKGRKLGFPTANVRVREKLKPGVYFGKTIIFGKGYRSAIFVPKEGSVVESHMLDFSGEIYGETIEIELGKKLRNVREFTNESGLIERIKKDIEIIRES